jgi:signal transduction histidine kinase
MDIKGSFRLFSIFSLGLLGLVLYFLTYNYFSGLEDSKKGNLTKLKAIVCTAALSIDGQQHQSIASKYSEKDAIRKSSEDSAYFKIHQQLKEIQEVNELKSPIYTMVFDSIQSDFRFIVSSSENPYFRHQYKRYPQKLLDDFNTGGVLDVYESENGTWLSAFAPIKDNQDQVVGLVQVDENFSSFLVIQRKELLSNSIISILLIAPFIIFFFHFLKKRVHQEEEFKEKIALQNDKIKNVNWVLTQKNQELDENKKLIQLKNKELDSKVRERTQELLRTNLELRNVLYRSSHDIMGPLATLDGLCRLAKVEFTNDKFEDYIDKIKNTTDGLTYRIKGLSKIYDIKNRKLICSSFSPALLLEKIFEAISINEPETKVKWIKEVSDEILIESDPELFYLAFHELFHIIKNNNESGDYIKIKYIKDKKECHCFIIEDNGTWINEEMKGEFKKLFKSNGNHLDSQGLKLYLAKTAIKKIDGNIELKSGQKNGVKLKVSIKV